jgi:hypothetical protein
MPFFALLLDRNITASKGVFGFEKQNLQRGIRKQNPRQHSLNKQKQSQPVV